MYTDSGRGKLYSLPSPATLMKPFYRNLLWLTLGKKQFLSHIRTPLAPKHGPTSLCQMIADVRPLVALLGPTWINKGAQKQAHKLLVCTSWEGSCQQVDVPEARWNDALSAQAVLARTLFTFMNQAELDDLIPGRREKMALRHTNNTVS